MQSGDTDGHQTRWGQLLNARATSSLFQMPLRAERRRAINVFVYKFFKNILALTSIEALAHKTVDELVA